MHMVENSNNAKRYTVKSIVYLSPVSVPSLLICLPPNIPICIYECILEMSPYQCVKASPRFSWQYTVPPPQDHPAYFRNTEWTWLFYITFVCMIIGWTPGDRALPGSGVSSLRPVQTPLTTLFSIGFNAVVLAQRGQRAPSSSCCLLTPVDSSCFGSWLASCQLLKGGGPVQVPLLEGRRSERPFFLFSLFCALSSYPSLESHWPGLVFWFYCFIS